MLRPPYGSMFRASEALAVLVTVLVLVVVPVEEVEPEVAAAVAGREESFASVYDHVEMVSFILHRPYLVLWRAPKERRLSQHVSRVESQLKVRNKYRRTTYSVRGGQASHILADAGRCNRSGDEVDSRAL